jgi:NAD(P)-dependent dehydrogenase (short-subunit alcohol dehydrogenase family)
MPGLYPEPIEEWLSDWQWEKREYYWLAAYAQSKFFQVAGANEMTRRWKGHGIVSHSLHPGAIKTNMYYENESLLSWVTFNVPPFSFFVKNVEQGSATQVFAAISPDHVEGGVYFDTCQPHYGPQQYWLKTHDPEVMEQIWVLSEEAVTGLGFSLAPL